MGIKQCWQLTCDACGDYAGEDDPEYFNTREDAQKFCDAYGWDYWPDGRAICEACVQAASGTLPPHIQAEILRRQKAVRDDH